MRESVPDVQDAVRFIGRNYDEVSQLEKAIKLIASWWSEG